MKTDDIKAEIASGGDKIVENHHPRPSWTFGRNMLHSKLQKVLAFHGRKLGSVETQHHLYMCV